MNIDSSDCRDLWIQKLLIVVTVFYKRIFGIPRLYSREPSVVMDIFLGRSNFNDTLQKYIIINETFLFYL